MKIGILVSTMNNFGEKGFYNAQEIGLGKTIAALGHRVIVYKFIPRGVELAADTERDGLTIKYRHAVAIGINGIVDTDQLDTDLDALVYFSDTQLAVPKVHKWCRKMGITLIPYIGVVESHSSNPIVRSIINILFARNLAAYRNHICMVKNSSVQAHLERMGIRNAEIAPVGVDLDLLNKDYESIPKEQLKMKYGFAAEDKVLLFIGRLQDEKRPIELIQYFKNILKKDEAYRLLIVGKGELKQAMMDEIDRLGVKDKVIYIEKIGNDKVWELYRLCDCFINLNQQEIFGMVLLEAMYYGIKVVAWHAPGPDYIIEHEKSGYLVSSADDLYRYILMEDKDIAQKAHDRVVNHLTWTKTARIVCDLACRK